MPRLKPLVNEHDFEVITTAVMRCRACGREYHSYAKCKFDSGQMYARDLRCAAKKEKADVEGE